MEIRVPMLLALACAAAAEESIYCSNTLEIEFGKPLFQVELFR